MKMKKQLFFFTGENEYELCKEVSHWKKSFISRHGEENLMVLEGSEADLSTLLDAVGTMPFIAEKRLILIEGVPRIERDELETLCSGIHPQAIVAVVDPKPDKRLSVTKYLKKKAETKIFKPLAPGALKGWLKDESKLQGEMLEDDAAKYLISIVGDDQWTLEKEWKKAALHAKGGPVTVKDVEEVAVPFGEQRVWQLTDLIGSKKPIEALEFLRRRLERGEDPYGLWSIVLNMVNNLVLVKAAQEAGNKGENAIAEATQIHPFSVRGVAMLARSMPWDRIRDLVNFAAEADIQLKSGGYRYTADRPEEVIALTERVILACS